ncbi:MAG TPA: C39 family peptidase [Clostridia bacterium]|nr:C39 family peptidase [Clostridia bacterium]
MNCPKYQAMLIKEESMVFFITLIIILILIILVKAYYILPIMDQVHTREIPKSYNINVSNRIDIQNNMECAAFSSAYILRHFGKEANGNELYKDYPKKLIDGNISPKGIINFFTKNGYKVSFVRGDISTLKKQISRGVPVIVFIKVFRNKRYLHYVPVVGYDDEYLYLADSLKFLINCDMDNYNRKILIKEFEALWNTWIPFYKKTYILVDECT